MRKSIKLITLFVFLGILFFAFRFPFSSPGKDTKPQTFVIPEETDDKEIVNKLKKENLIRYSWAFKLVLNIKKYHGKISPGGYYISPDMNAFEVADKLMKADMKWVKVIPGLRKEQIGERLANTFNWSEDELNKWNTVYTRMNYDYREGVYYPDTYLIPVNETGLEIAKRMINRFNEKMAAYFPAFEKANIKWTTALKIASLIQREAGGKDDMPVIAGVIWNRLEKGMLLQIDAEIQYAKGKVKDQWWSHVSPEDIREIDSLYNSYKYKGLPPTPIANPGIDAIDAVLNSLETDCLFYLHDSNRQIHCSETYEGHLENIKKYL
ncbi:MAG: Aminodeoxychorismate lyase [Candidatus Gottesmanbacteria bacterium GW2011_GWC2_39_8]|uniref:Endolytic murein transglycosylase n=1 Tax=Candidatus Gottesmanbacteria bacterium GW2011_GWC2_39_8 TaxID=1618450 RepID=A0A0G0QA93_9BACT|nr:MAG: Aminodeoxychorismate lyase [Candidatus Gottesmanbacteria bacterium GW2011_GWC2_39_8]